MSIPGQTIYHLANFHAFSVQQWANGNSPMFVYASLNFSATRIKHKALC